MLIWFRQNFDLKYLHAMIKYFELTHLSHAVVLSQIFKIDGFKTAGKAKGYEFFQLIKKILITGGQ